jgi:hypothetical protein
VGENLTKIWQNISLIDHRNTFLLAILITHAMLVETTKRIKLATHQKVSKVHRHLHVIG